VALDSDATSADDDATGVVDEAGSGEEIGVDTEPVA